MAPAVVLGLRSCAPTTENLNRAGSNRKPTPLEADWSQASSPCGGGSSIATPVDRQAGVRPDTSWNRPNFQRSGSLQAPPQCTDASRGSFSRQQLLEDRAIAQAAAGGQAVVGEVVVEMLNYVLEAKKNKERLTKGASAITPLSGTPCGSFSLREKFLALEANALTRPRSAGAIRPSRPRSAGFVPSRPKSAGFIRPLDIATDNAPFATVAGMPAVPSKKKFDPKSRPRSAGPCSPPRAHRTKSASGSRPLSALPATKRPQSATSRPQSATQDQEVATSRPQPATRRRRKVVRRGTTPKGVKTVAEDLPLTEEEGAWMVSTLRKVPRVFGKGHLGEWMRANPANSHQGGSDEEKRSRADSGFTESSACSSGVAPLQAAPGFRRGSDGQTVSIVNIRRASMATRTLVNLQKARASAVSFAPPPTLATEHMMAEGAPPTGDPAVDAYRTRVLARMKSASDGFEIEDLDRMRGAYSRHIFPGSGEVHLDDLVRVMSHLGYHKATQEHVEQICKDLALFNTVSFEEFTDFVLKWTEVERDELVRVFDECDLDGNERLSVDEVEGLCEYLGIAPLREALLEALRLVDSDLSGNIDKEEFLELVAVLRATEGFSNKEIIRLRRIFDRFARPATDGGERTEMDAERIVESLCQMFGPQCEKAVAKMVKSNCVGVSGVAPGARRGSVSSDGVTFQQFLGWARRQRATDMQEYLIKFEEIDEDHSGLIDPKELANLIRSLGYVPLERVVQEMLIDISGDPHAEIDFDEFVKLMSIFNTRDGFTQKEINNYQKTFDAFAADEDDNKDELSCLELMSLLRSLGFNPKLSEVHKFIDQVDFNDDHSVDFREFLRLMRTQREDELRRAQRAFHIFIDPHDQKLPSETLRAAMLATDVRWGKLPRETFETILRDLGSPEAITFDAFADIIQKGRSILAMEMKHQAGFSAKEIDQFKDLFATYDFDKNGTIERSELSTLLIDLHIPMKTWNDQHAMVGMLLEAKKAAVEAGLESDDGEDQEKHPHVTFWMLVYFLRMLCNKDDKQEAEHEEEAARDAGFNQKELNEFRDIFVHWAEVELARAAMHAGDSSDASIRRRKMSKQRLEKAQDGPIAAFASTDDSKKHLSIDGVSRMLRSMNLKMGISELTELERKMGEIDSTGAGALDFASFLRLMNWMMAKNFTGINDAATQLAISNQSRPSSGSAQGVGTVGLQVFH